MHAEQSAKVIPLNHVGHEPTQIYVLRDNLRIGPISQAECLEGLKSGRFTADDLAWHEGMSDWTPLGEVLNLPLPPPAPAVSSALVPAAAPAATAAGGMMQNMKGFISAKQLRVRKERGALIFSIASFLAAWIILEFTTFGPFVPVSVLIIPSLIAAFIAIAYQQSSLKGSGVRISEKQMADIHRSISEAGENICFSPPEVYLVQSRELNAYALGMFGKDAIILNSETIDAMEDKELQFIIGHELTHIKCGHTFWKIIGTKNPVFRFWVLRMILPLFMKWWSRQAEFTADRGGLLACRDLDAAVAALAKLTVGKKLFERLDVNELVGQISLTESDHMSKLSGSMQSHPDIAQRIQKLIEFARSEEYRELTTETPAAGSA